MWASIALPEVQETCGPPEALFKKPLSGVAPGALPGSQDRPMATCHVWAPAEGNAAAAEGLPGFGGIDCAPTARPDTLLLLPRYHRTVPHTYTTVPITHTTSVSGVQPRCNCTLYKVVRNKRVCSRDTFCCQSPSYIHFSQLTLCLYCTYIDTEIFQ